MNRRIILSALAGFVATLIVVHFGAAFIWLRWSWVWDWEPMSRTWLLWLSAWAGCGIYFLRWFK